MTDVAPDTGTDAITDTTATTSGNASEASDTLTPDALAAEVDKWKALARKHEDQAKANKAAAKELEAVKAASMSDQEKAVAEAVAKARSETLLEVGGQLAAAQIRVAAAGRLADEQVDTLLDTVNLAKFLTDDGTVDVARVQAFVDGIAPKPDTDGVTQIPDLGQGTRSSSALPLNGDPMLNSVKDMLGLRR